MPSIGMPASRCAPPPRLLPAAALVIAAFAAHGPAVAADGVVVERSISVQQTITDNGGLGRNGERKSDAITEISPGISITSRSGRTVGSLDYRLDAVGYARDSGRSELRNVLSADGSTELVDNHVFVDAAASVSQQSISAFGVQSGGTNLSNDNTSEVSTVTVSPRARTRVAGLVDVDATASWTKTHSADSAVGDSTTWDASVGAGARHGIFGWGVNATRESDDYAEGERLTNDRLVGTLSVAPTSRLRLSARGGRERADYPGGSATDWSSNTGWGIDWNPTPRTQLSLQSDERYYGRSHAFSLNHRFRRAVVTYTDSRSISGRDTDALGPLRGVYAQVYAICMAAVNNPSLCTEYTRAQLGFNPTQSLAFLSSAPSLQRSQALALALSTARDSFTLSAARLVSERLEQFEYAGDDLQNLPRVRQMSLTFGASHKLTPQASLSLTLSLFRALDERRDDGTLQPGNDQRRIEVGLSDSFGPRTTGTLSVRHVRFDSDSSALNPTNSSYRESALIGSLNHRF